MIESVFYAGRNAVKKGDARRLAALRRKKLWIDIRDPTKEDMAFLKTHFGFHKLALEDCIHAIQRPKIDDYGDYYFIAMHELDYRNGKLVVREVDFFIGRNYVITVHNGRSTCVDTVEREVAKSAMLQRGPDFLLYVMLDIIVDGLFPVTDTINERVDSLEHEIFRNPKKDIVNRLFTLRREILTLRKYVSPEREVLNILTRGNAKFVDNRTIVYMRDVYDHLYRIAEGIDISRDIITTSFESYLSTISNKTNEIMKTLTIITTLILPMTVITGIYGMNFEQMPEIRWTYGYPFALGVMLVIAVIMIFYFRKKGLM